ncbi:MAG: hypothetical protein HC785_17550 [Calothrix sp. CSU_2_0]|nr:hypothetical protein [Calothrix sp. CSU_2_0]
MGQFCCLFYRDEGLKKSKYLSDIIKYFLKVCSNKSLRNKWQGVNHHAIA